MIEEILKLGGAYFAGLHKKDCDEPIDPMIYLITAALGFAGLENVLFLISSISDNFISGIVTGNLRFVGASLLHVLCSGVIGLFFAFSFYKGRISKIIHLTIGLVLAITLHALFNFFIISTKGGGTFIVFAFVWISIVLLLAGFEKVKTIKK
jgi:RsiW-degrading membrane proteinase PrsW (M82 family)